VLVVEALPTMVALVVLAVVELVVLALVAQAQAEQLTLGLAVVEPSLEPLVLVGLEL
jgi:hypothetical protein